MKIPLNHADTGLLKPVPPHALVLLAVLAIQLGAGISIQLFEKIGAEATVALRVILSALILSLVARKNLSELRVKFVQHWQLLLIFGLCVSAMNYCFYKAIDRIPLGAAVAIEFAGPLSVAAFTSKKFTQLGWVILAAIGIVLLSPFTGTNLDTTGVVFALLSGVGWASFIVLAKRVSAKVEQNIGLAIGMGIAAITMIPFLLPQLDQIVLFPKVLLLGFCVALFSTAIPFTFEFVALKRLSSTAYGVLVSTEPVVATLIGALLLDQRIGVQGLIAIACVVTAAIGITVSTPPATSSTNPPESK